MQGHSAQQTDQAAQQGIEKTFLNQTMRRGMAECRRFRQQDGQSCASATPGTSMVDEIPRAIPVFLRAPGAPELADEARGWVRNDPGTLIFWLLSCIFIDPQNAAPTPVPNVPENQEQGSRHQKHASSGHPATDIEKGGANCRGGSTTVIAKENGCAQHNAARSTPPRHNWLALGWLVRMGIYLIRLAFTSRHSDETSAPEPSRRGTTSDPADWQKPVGQHLKATPGHRFQCHCCASFP